MSNPPWMPLYIADYLSDTGHMRAAESGAYLHLIMHYWQRGGLPDCDRQLAMIARMSDQEWSNAKAIVQAMFKPGWKHKRIDEELANAKERYERRANAGRKGGKAKRKPDGSNEGSASEAMLNHKYVVVPSEQPTIYEDSSKGNSKKDLGRGLRAREIAGLFERFWVAYPRRDGANPRAPAFKVFSAAVKSGHDPEDIIGGAERYREKVRQSGQEGTPYVAQAVTWLRQARWEDYPMAVPEPVHGPPQPPNENCPTDDELRRKYAQDLPAEIGGIRGPGAGPLPDLTGGQEDQGCASNHQTRKPGMESVGKILSRFPGLRTGVDEDHPF
jgi:uncharacterized protein YdaU (DUF1376 family)